MPTKLHRCYGAGYLHFVTTSCYRRSALLGTPQNRDLFLEVVEQVRRRYRFVVVGYVVMPEHVHLLFSEPERGDLSVVMKVLKTVLRPGGWRTHPNRGCPIRRGFRRMGTAKAGTVGFVAGLTVATTSSPFSTALHNKNPDSCDEQPLLRTQERANSPYARVLHRQELLQVRS